MGNRRLTYDDALELCIITNITAEASHTYALTVAESQWLVVTSGYPVSTQHSKWKEKYMKLGRGERDRRKEKQLAGA